MAIKGGARAAPKPSPMVCRPCTSGQRRGGNQVSNTPVETGKVGACATPMRNWAPNITANMAMPVSRLGANTVATMHTTEAAPIITNIRRAPQRWPSTPPGIWNSM